MNFNIENLENATENNTPLYMNQYYFLAEIFCPPNIVFFFQILLAEANVFHYGIIISVRVYKFFSFLRLVAFTHSKKNTSSTNLQIIILRDASRSFLSTNLVPWQ